MKRNRTAIAPTYIIININPKKSIPNNIKIIETEKNIEIKKSTEFIVFKTDIIKIAEETIKVYNIVINRLVINYYKNKKNKIKFN